MIISSSITNQSLQVDGRIYVTERHDDDSGKIYIFTYLAEAGSNVTATLNARGASLNVDSDYYEVENEDGTITTVQA